MIYVVHYSTNGTQHLLGVFSTMEHVEYAMRCHDAEYCVQEVELNEDMFDRSVPGEYWRSEGRMISNSGVTDDNGGKLT